MRKYFLTTYTIKVLSEGEHVEDLSPRELAEAIDTGDCVGVTETSSRELSGQSAADMLFEFGSEPEFFGLDKEGNEE